MGDRLLCYELANEGSQRWLTAHLHVSYHFPHAEGWAPGGRGRWKTNFRAHAEQTWSNRFALFSEGSWLSSNSVVRVRLRVHEVAPGTVHRTRHWWVAVNSPRRDVREWRTRTIYRANGPLPHSDIDSAGSGMIKVHARDVECGWLHGDRPGDPATMQRGTDHEIGHMLGMQHPYCNGGHVDEGDTSSASCYWRPGQFQGRSRYSYSLMGVGSRVESADYAWAKNLIEQIEGRRYELRLTREIAATCGPAGT